ncbi:hypothetical protein [Saccharibacillus qingshengii]|uniref:hypothetical protein n=1 Tax=Saccharibacillus qingshengii TaxID=1763540 RepID=UPI001552BF51|nr:hypothetical protein [Saccharibacillus qingshengii]
MELRITQQKFQEWMDEWSSLISTLSAYETGTGGSGIVTNLINDPEELIQNAELQLGILLPRDLKDLVPFQLLIRGLRFPETHTL